MKASSWSATTVRGRGSAASLGPSARRRAAHPAPLSSAGLASAVDAHALALFMWAQLHLRAARRRETMDVWPPAAGRAPPPGALDGRADPGAEPVSPRRPGAGRGAGTGAGAGANGESRARSRRGGRAPRERARPTAPPSLLPSPRLALALHLRRPQGAS